MKCYATIFLFSCILFLSLPSVQAQPPARHTLSGYVRERGSGELLPGVSVQVAGRPVGTVTNTYGFYSLTLPMADSLRVTFSSVGYAAAVNTLAFTKDLSFDVLLTPQTQQLETVTVQDEADKVSQTDLMSVVSVPIRQIKQIPALLAEKDVLKVLQLMPGVQKGTEGTAGLYVRGGGPDQNLIILDDAIVYNAFHLFGFFSLFNGDALKSVSLIKGGFPARYGGRLSSVVEMQTKEGNKEAWHGEGGIGLLSSRLTIEGPLRKGKSSVLLSGRRTYADVLLRPLMPAGERSGLYFTISPAKSTTISGAKTSCT